MILQTVEIAELKVSNGAIGVTLAGNIAPFPVFIYWDGVRYDLDNILGDRAIINGSRITFPEKMLGDKINIDYWTLSVDEIPISNNSATNSKKAICSGVRFIFNNCIPDCALMSSVTHPLEMGIDNIKTDWRSKIVRNTDISQKMTISGRLGASRTISGFALSRFNLSSSAQVSLRIYNKEDTLMLAYPKMGVFVWGVDAWGVESEDLNYGIVYNSYIFKAMSPKPQGEFVWGVDAWGINNIVGINPTFALYFNQVYGNYFELDIYNPDNTDGYIDIGQVFLGDTVILDYNFSYGMKFSWQNSQKYERTEGGSLITIGNSQAWREASLPFEMMTDADRVKITNEQRNNAGKAVFVSIFPEQENTEFEMPAKIIPPTFSLSGFGRWANTLDLREI